MSLLRLVPGLPGLDETVEYIQRKNKVTASALLRAAEGKGAFLSQPRCGVGSHGAMIELLNSIDLMAEPDILTLTVDSYTRLLKLQDAERVLREQPTRLNGYPVIAHGYLRIRELNEIFPKPIQVRHGSPDGRALFAVSVAGGITSYEGAGIGYNLPYCKRVPLKTSLDAWREVDEFAGCLYQRFGIEIEREFFGTLSAVLVPPAVSLSVLFLEARLAANAGCPVLTLAYPQSGSIVQDVAALAVIRKLAERYLPTSSKVYPALHQFMGVFPRDRQKAESIIFLGGLTARLGRATKVITKTYQEAIGVPTAQANAAGIKQTQLTLSSYFSALTLDESAVNEEAYWIERETRELLDDIIDSDRLADVIPERFSRGLLDIPFPSNPEAKGNVIPIRDGRGAVRFAKTGNLPFSAKVIRRNNEMIESVDLRSLHQRVRDSILYFA